MLPATIQGIKLILLPHGVMFLVSLHRLPLLEVEDLTASHQRTSSPGCRETKLTALKPIWRSLRTESAFNPEAQSPAGAIGLMQVMPANYKRCGLPHRAKLWNERINAECGKLKSFREELATYKGNLINALKAYNGALSAFALAAKNLSNTLFGF